LTAERDRLTNALTAAQAQVADASVAATAAAQTVASRDQALAARTGELEAMRSDMTRLQQDAATAQAQVQAKEQEAARLARQSDALGDEVLRLAAVLGGAEQRCSSKSRSAPRSARSSVAAGRHGQSAVALPFEFFAKLGTALGNRSDFTVVGDRFVVQSEICSPPARPSSARRGGPSSPRSGARCWRSPRHSRERAMGGARGRSHDDVPIQSSRFASNWELSSARAISVVRFLIDQGVPAEHLAATGFGEYQPIASGTDPESRRRNRRIELKLTER
jgi:chemotaxis protein MotB